MEMKNKEKYDLNTLKIEWTPQTAERRFFTIKFKSDESTIFSKEMTSDENGTSAYNAWLEEEYKPPILDVVEKAYLSAVIKPFRKDVAYIEKCIFSMETDYVLISMKNNETVNLPNFRRKSMYTGMKEDRRYTLEDLGL